VGDELPGAPLAVLVQRLAGKPGAEIPLRLRRGGTERDVKLVLRPYI
jgi:hypothetical protein